ncbi:hypothetical protein, partial [Nocardia mangyaensis]|uniref:hypothetical protein n=1 Tax=Nocardia mangyaensis TaxID=2213200 RepID=UPI002674FD66
DSSGEESSEDESEESDESDNDEVLEEQTLNEVTKESIKRLLLKIDGEEIEEELPFEIPKEAEDYMKKQIQLAKVAQKRMQEKATVEKNFHTFIEEFKKNPEFLMKEYGMDPEEWAETLIERQIEELEKSPEQKALEAKDRESAKKEQELAEMRRRLEEIENEKKQKEMEAQHQKDVEEARNEISSAITKQGILPDNEFVRQQVASLWYQYASNGKNVTADDVVTQVYQQMSEQMQEIMGILPDEAIEKFLGKQTTERVKKKFITKKKEPPKPISKQVSDGVTENDIKRQEKAKIDMREWLKHGSGTLADLAKKK